MNKELREILHKLQQNGIYLGYAKGLSLEESNKKAEEVEDRAIRRIEKWHIRERKKWAMGLLKEEEERVAKWNEQYQAQKDGVKDVIFSIRKNIEEG